MKHIFITYGDTGYEAAKAKIVQGAKDTGEFDEIHAYRREDLSDVLLASDVIKIKRGGGLWSWKPDVILSTMEQAQEGDIIVYCDAGCTLYPSKEWKRYWKKLETHDILAQRIYQRVDKWTRKELLDMFPSNGDNWKHCYQYLATVIALRVCEFSRNFVKEWRNMMILNPDIVMDVTPEERVFQHPTLIENRHDQALYSSIVYKYLSNHETKERIYTQWEHIEDLDLLCKQAIRATRLRQGEQESASHKRIAIVKRLIKDFCLKQFYYAPLQWWHSR